MKVECEGIVHHFFGRPVGGRTDSDAAAATVGRFLGRYHLCGTVWCGMEYYNSIMKVKKVESICLLGLPVLSVRWAMKGLLNVTFVAI